MSKKILAAALAGVAATWSTPPRDSFWVEVLYDLPPYLLVFAAVYLAIEACQSSAKEEHGE